MRLPALTFLLALALPAGGARADLASARAHLAAGQLEPVLEDLADSAKLPAAEVANVFAEASALALAKGDRSLAGIYCERALSREPNQAKALRTCTTVALEEGRFLEAREWGDSLGALLPKDGEVALLRARASKALESWEMVVAVLEPFETDKGLQARVAPLLAEARQRLSKGPSASPDTAEAKLEAAVRAARELDREKRTTEFQVNELEGKKARRPFAGKVVFYAARRSEESDRAREWLKENDVDFEEKNADHAARADREFLKHCDVPRTGPRGIPIPHAPKDCTVPLFLIDGTPVRGFNVERLKQLLGR